MFFKTHSSLKDALKTYSTELKNLASGLIAPGHVSIHKAEEIGMNILRSWDIWRG